MKRSAIPLLTGVALGACMLAGTALAADITPPPPPPPPPEPVFSWEHTVYAGVQLGYGFGTKDWQFPIDLLSHGVSGLLAGAQLGINVQRNTLVVGSEIDVDWSRITGSAPCPNPAVTCSTSVNWLATWTGKVGVDVGPIIYVEGGAAVARETFYAFENADPTNDAATLFTNWGWTVGTGVEFDVGPGWLVDLEYNYVNFGTTPVLVNDISGGPVLDSTVTQALHLIRLGVSKTF